MIVLTKDNFEKEISAFEGAAVIDLYADWCAPCKMLAPIVAELEAELTDIKFCKVNVDEEGELAEKYSIVSIPSIMLFKNGEIVKRSVGAVPKPKIEEMLKD